MALLHNSIYHLRPLFITADEHFHSCLRILPGLSPFCLYLSPLENIYQLSSLLGKQLLIFADIDSYDMLSLISLICRLKDQHEVFVVGVSASDGLDRVISYLKSGLHGYFLKSEITADLLFHAGCFIKNRTFMRLLGS